MSRLEQIADEFDRIGDAFITGKMDAGGVFLTKQTAIGALLLAACKAGAFEPSLTAELQLLETQRAMGGAIWCAVYNHLAKGGKISQQENADATGWCVSCHAIARSIRIQPAQVRADPSANADPVLNEIDVKILKELAKHQHAVKYADLAMAVSHDRDTCSKYVNKTLIPAKYVTPNGDRGGVAITQPGRDRLGREPTKI